MNRSYRFPAGTLHVEVPNGWREVSEESVISFSSPTETAALTVTVFTDPRLSPEDIERINAEKKPFGVPRSQKRPLRVSKGNGYAREFEKQKGEGSSYWIAHFLFFPTATVVASVNGPLDEMREHKVEFEQILASIEAVDSK